MSDLTLKEAVTRLQTQGGLFKAVMVISDEIDKIGKIEQLTSEANAAHSAAVAAHEKAVASMAQERKAQEAGLVKITAELAVAQTDADAVRDQAKAILADAKDKVSKALSVAKDKAQAMIADAEAKAKASADMVAANAKALADGEVGLASKAKELADIERRIEAARETIKKMMGG